MSVVASAFDLVVYRQYLRLEDLRQRRRPPTPTTLGFGVLLRLYMSSNNVTIHRFVRPHLVINERFDCVLPVLTCVLDCACRDKPS
jgi:hypothetical protein